MTASTATEPTYPWLRNYPPFVKWDIPLPSVPVYRLLQDAAEQFPNHPFLEFLGRRWTYAETIALAARAACRFSEDRRDR